MFRQNTIVQLKAREDTKYDADVTVTVQQIIDSYGCSPVSNIASLLYWFITWPRPKAGGRVLKCCLFVCLFVFSSGRLPVIQLLIDKFQSSDVLRLSLSA